MIWESCPSLWHLCPWLAGWTSSSLVENHIYWGSGERDDNIFPLPFGFLGRGNRRILCLAPVRWHQAL